MDRSTGRLDIKFNVKQDTILGQMKYQSQLMNDLGLYLVPIFGTNTVNKTLRYLNYMHFKIMFLFVC